MTLALEMRGITKRFPGVVANDHVAFQLAQGEIHALLGENGAGKTTLMHILYGLSRPDEGEIVVHGAPVGLTSPSDAMAHGIGLAPFHATESAIPDAVKAQLQELAASLKAGTIKTGVAR